MKKRIIGIDVARALAVIGMIIVNFKIVFGQEGSAWLKSAASIVDGKAAATFVVLAGIGLALMTNSAIRNKDAAKLKKARTRIAKRAIFLFVVGLSYIVIWPADILHFYGIYMAIILLLLNSKEKTILLVAVAFIFAFPLLVAGIDYETSWNFDTYMYKDFWTMKGFVRNLFFNGFHPVIPWTAFILYGYWLGKQDLANDAFVKKAFRISAIAFITIQVISYTSIALLSDGSAETTKELTQILGTHPMPPLPLYMFNGMAIATAIISACILIAKRFENSLIIDALYKTGQLALTFYVAHVVLGMGVIASIYPPEQFGKFSIHFSLGYSLAFGFLCIVFAVIWRKYKQAGPLEWVMRKLTD